MVEKHLNMQNLNMGAGEKTEQRQKQYTSVSRARAEERGEWTGARSAVITETASCCVLVASMSGAVN